SPLAVPAAGWVGFVHPEITPPSNFHHLRDRTAPATTSVFDLVVSVIRLFITLAGR
ncbi:hypothetical protein ABIE58_003978, partial [Roseovarius sp. MBR-78]